MHTTWHTVAILLRSVWVSQSLLMPSTPPGSSVSVSIGCCCQVFWFSAPESGRIAASIPRGRQAILAAIQRSRYDASQPRLRPTLFPSNAALNRQLRSRTLWSHVSSAVTTVPWRRMSADMCVWRSHQVQGGAGPEPAVAEAAGAQVGAARGLPRGRPGGQRRHPARRHRRRNLLPAQGMTTGWGAGGRVPYRPVNISRS